MVNPLIWIDEKILLFFTKVSHKFQILTGKTNFFLAKICAFLCITVFLFFLLNNFTEILGRKTDGTIVLLTCFLIFSMYRQARFSDFYDDKFFQEPNFINDRAIGPDRVFRIMALFISLPITVGYFRSSLLFPKGSLIIKVFCSLVGIYFISYSYFMAVTPLPPGKSKIREFVDSLLPKPKPVSLENR